MTKFGYIQTRILENGQKDKPKTVYRQFNSLSEKYKFLTESTNNKQFFGAPAAEMLTVGGNRNIMWLDIDSKRAADIDDWLYNSHPFSEGTFRRVRSTSGNTHVYVNVDRILKKDECFSMLEWIVARAPDTFAMNIDRVYGQQNLEPVFLPVYEGRATIPQFLLTGINKQFCIPTLVGSIYSEWKKRNSC